MDSTPTLRTLEDAGVSEPAPRRRFAARKYYGKTGWAVVAAGIAVMALCTLGGLHGTRTAIGDADAAMKGLFFLIPGGAGLAMVIAGIYLLRGRRER